MLRDLDLWPECAEKKADGTNPYGFIERKQPNADGKGGNLNYWEMTKCNDRVRQVSEQIERHKKEGNNTLERQGVKIFISDRWTFEFCLARFGLFPECCEALGRDQIDGTADEKATFVQKEVAKTDFAYLLATILEKQLAEQIRTKPDGIDESEIKTTFATEMKLKLPKYIVKAIEYVTASIDAVDITEEQEDATYA